VLADPGSGAILLCSTGIGMSIIANKFRGIRAALCTDGFMAKMTRKHNDSNVLCLGGRVSGEYEIQDIVERWLATEFEGERHKDSLYLISLVDDEINSGEMVRLADTPEEEEMQGEKPTV